MLHMKKRLLLFVILVSSISMNGQIPLTIDTTLLAKENFSVTYTKGFGGNLYFQNGKQLRMSELVRALKSNPVAYTEIKKAQTNYAFSTVFVFVGGFMTGYSLGPIFSGGEIDKTHLGIGLGCIAVTIPFAIQTEKHAKTAVDMYNYDLMEQSFWNDKSLDFNLTGSSVALRFNF